MRVPRLPRRLRHPLALGALLLALPAATRAQITSDPPDQTPPGPPTEAGVLDSEAGEDRSPSLSPTFFPPFGWAPTPGFGIGVGVRAENLFRPRTQALATALVSQHVGQYGLSLGSKDPREPGPDGMARAFYETTGRRYFRGVGPTSRRGDNVAVEKELFETELRAGYTLPPRARLRVQAHGRYALHATHSTRDTDRGARGRLDPASTANLDATIARDVGVWTVGADVLHDSRNSPFVAQRGILAQVGTGYSKSVVGADVSFVRTYATFDVFRPVRFRDGVVGGHAAVVKTSAVEGTLPFVLLPVLDTGYHPALARERYATPDFVVLSADLAFPVFDVLGAVSLDAIGGVGVVGAYTSLFDEFTPALSFDADLAARGGRYPLRPVATVGARLYSGLAEGIEVNAQLGFSPEGLNLALVSVVTDLRALRPLQRW